MYLLLATFLALFNNHITAETVQLDEITIVELMETEVIPEGDVAVVVEIKGETKAVDTLKQKLPLFTRESGGVGHPVTLSVNGSTPQQLSTEIEGFQYSAPLFASFAPALFTLGSFDSVQFARRGHSGTFNYQLSKKSRFTLLGGSSGTNGFLIHLPGKKYSFGGSFLQAENDFEYRDSNGNNRTRQNNSYKGINLYLIGTPSENLKWLQLLSLTGRGAPGSVQFEHTDSTIREFEYLGGIRYKNLFDWGEINTRGSYGFKQFRYDDILMQQLGHPVVDYDLFLHHLKIESTVDYFFNDFITLNGGVVLNGYLIDITDQLSDDLNKKWLQGRFFIGGEGSWFDEKLTINGELSFDPVDLIPGYRGTLTIKPKKWYSGTITHRRGIRYPYPEELYLSSDTIRGNPDLDPEITYETTINNRFQKWGGVIDLELFYKKVHNNIVFLPISFNLLKGSNLPELTLYGGTLKLGYSYRFGELQHRTTYLRGELKGEMRPPHTPKWQHHTTLTLRTGETGWFLTGIRTESDETYIDLYNVRTLPAKTLYHLMGGYRASGWKLQLKIENVTNQRDLFDTFHQPLPARGVYLQLMINEF